MTGILFGQAYFLRFDHKLWAEMKPYPPLGSLYAAAIMRREGYQVAFFDAMLAGSEQDWGDRLAATKPRYAVLFEDNFNYLSKMCLLRMREAAFRMLAMAKEAGCTAIVCGADASDRPESYLGAGADYILIGEGDHTLVDLVHALEHDGGEALHSIDGIAFPDAKGGLCRTPRRAVIRDLDALPFPARDLLDTERYRNIWLDRHGYTSTNLVTTRGCPYHCNWCAKPIWGQRYNSRSPENVVAEIAQLVEQGQLDHIWFADDIMGLKPGWLGRFADGLEEYGLRVPFKCLSRADLLLRGDAVAHLARAGCQTVWIGAESGSQKILDAMEKGTTVEQVREATARLVAAGIRVGYFVQFGYPGETRADIDKTLNLIKEARPDEVGVSVSYPLPGTKFHERVREQLGEQQNWRDSEDLAMLYKGPFNTSFYRQVHRLLHSRLRLRRHLEALAPLIRRPWLWRPGHLRRLAALAYHGGQLLGARLGMALTAGRPAGTTTVLPKGLEQQAAASPTVQEWQAMSAAGDSHGDDRPSGRAAGMTP